jgi:hypothetical protein
MHKTKPACGPYGPQMPNMPESVIFPISVDTVTPPINVKAVTTKKPNQLLILRNVSFSSAGVIQLALIPKSLTVAFNKPRYLKDSLAK